MAKQNFSRVEQALDEGLKKYQAQKLLQEAETAGKIGKGAEGVRGKKKIAAQHVEEMRQQRRLTVAAMKVEIDNLFKRDPHVYTAIKTNHDEVNDLFNRIDVLNSSELDRLESLQQELKQYKEKKKAERPTLDDALLVEKERKKHINKRYNVNDKWLPLH